jgi:hypothetical protein
MGKSGEGINARVLDPRRAQLRLDSHLADNAFQFRTGNWMFWQNVDSVCVLGELVMAP